MRVTNEVYTVELTKEEIDILVRVLADEVAYRSGGVEVKALRNGFANILDIHFLGKDA